MPTRRLQEARDRVLPQPLQRPALTLAHAADVLPGPDTAARIVDAAARLEALLVAIRAAREDVEQALQEAADH
jgi:hypothetical protein